MKDYTMLFRVAQVEMTKRIMAKEGKKDGWDSLPIEIAVGQIDARMMKLSKDMKLKKTYPDTDTILQELVDIANYAAMGILTLTNHDIPLTEENHREWYDLYWLYCSTLFGVERADQLDDVNDLLKAYPGETPYFVACEAYSPY